MTVTTWDKVNPVRDTPKKETSSITTETQVSLSRYVTMPEDNGTLSIELAHSEARDYASFGNPSDSTLERLERMDAEERYQWATAVEETGDPQQAFRSMYLDDNLPGSAVHVVRNPEEWVTLDPSDIQTRTCHVRDETLYRVEVDGARYSGDGVTYVNESGTELGGQPFDELDAFRTIDDEEIDFISQDAINELREDSVSSNTMVAFLPENDDKVHIETKGGIIKDVGMEESSDKVPLSDYPEIEAIFEAIIEGDSDSEALEGWVPLSPRSDSGGSRRAMRNKVEEIIGTHVDDYYMGMPLLAADIREGEAAGKRYVATPEEEAEEVDNLLFNPDLY